MLSRKFFFLTYTSPGNGCGETQESKQGETRKMCLFPAISQNLGLGDILKVTYFRCWDVAEFRAVPPTLCERSQAGRLADLIDWFLQKAMTHWDPSQRRGASRSVNHALFADSWHNLNNHGKGAVTASWRFYLFSPGQKPSRQSKSPFSRFHQSQEAELGLKTQSLKQQETPPTGKSWTLMLGTKSQDY